MQLRGSCPVYSEHTTKRKKKDIVRTVFTHGSGSRTQAQHIKSEATQQVQQLRLTC
jgi:hypothetical protein